MVNRQAFLTGAGLVLLALFPTGPLKSAPPKVSRSFVLFCVEAGESMASIDPVALIGNGGAIRAPFPPESDVLSRRFVERWLKPGLSYRVYFGGAPSGTATVREMPGDPGISLQARVALKTSTMLQGRTMALAVSDTGGGASRPMNRRALTAAERAALVMAAQTEFRRNGVSAAMAQSAKVIEAAVLNLDGAGRPEIVARLQASNDSGPRCDLFVIAEPQGASELTLGLVVVNKDKRTSTMEDVNYIEQGLVDALDLNKDGIAEVVTRSVYYESHDYTIFRKRRGGIWRKVYRGAGGGV